MIKTGLLANLVIGLLLVSSCVNSTDPNPTQALVAPSPPTQSSSQLGEGSILFWDIDAGEFYLVNPDGTNMRSVLTNREYLGMSLSLHGDKLAYWFNGFIFIQLVQSGETRQINQEPIGSYQSGQIAWSPDGQNIAFDCILADLEHSDLCVMNLDTGEYEALTDFHQEAVNGISLGSWSTDGKWIAFVHEHFPQEGFAEGVLQIIEVSNGKIRSLYDEREFPEISYVAHPAISPDGKTILFQANINDVPEIFFLDISSGEVAQVTEASNQYGISWPVWNPSGQSFFASTAFKDEDGEFQLRPTLFSLNGEVIWESSNMNGWIVAWVE